MQKLTSFITDSRTHTHTHEEAPRFHHAEPTKTVARLERVAS